MDKDKREKGRIKIELELPDGRRCYVLIRKKHYEKLDVIAEAKLGFWRRFKILFFGTEE